jgi:ABC-type polar amino acid transport system ATPase subunit
MIDAASIASAMTMIVVTHEMEFADEVADRMMMFDEGTIIEIRFMRAIHIVRGLEM